MSCKKVTELVEKRKVIALSTMEKLQMNLHITMCQACRAYQQQSGLIDKAIDRLHIKSSKSNKKLTPEVKEKIIKGLKKSE